MIFLVAISALGGALLRVENPSSYLQRNLVTVTIEIVNLPDLSTAFNVVAVAHLNGEPPLSVGIVEVRRSSDDMLACPKDEGGEQADCHYEIEQFRKKYEKYLLKSRDLLAVYESNLTDAYRGKGIGIAMYIAAAQEAGRRGALLIANTCEDGGITSREADHVWGSGAFRKAADVNGWVAFVPPDRQPVTPGAR